MNPAIAVANYVYGAQHAWILACILESALSAFTAHTVTKLVGSGKADLVEFVLHDLVRIKLLSIDRSIFFPATINIDEAVKRFPDGHLVRDAAGC